MESFPGLVNTSFTAEMESSLDLIEEGSESWTETLNRFYGPFQSDLKQADKNMKNIKREGIFTNETCPKCNEPLLIRSGRYGLFMGCSAYPECDYTRNIETDNAPDTEPVMTDEKCQNCGAPMSSEKVGQVSSCPARVIRNARPPVRFQ